MRKIGYILLSLYLILVGLISIIPGLMVHSLIMAALALVAGVCIFIDAINTKL